VPFQKNRNFVGRSSQLDRLEHTVFAKDQPQKIAVTGLGGIGKTQIVLELAFRTRDKHPDCSIFWIPATNAESFQQAFVHIGRQLGVLGPEEKQTEAKKLVQRHLSQDSAGQWLLIVDNIDDMEMWKDEVKGYLPLSPQGCIVCTTRSREVAVKIAAANVIEVSEMDEKIAMQLLSKLLINQELLPSCLYDAHKLLEQLTFLPLAIVQAAAYINAKRMGITDYLSLLEEQEKDVVDLLSKDFEDDWRYPDGKNPVVTTWLVSFEHVRKLDPLAAEYLSFMACMVSKDIPQSLLPPGLSRMKEMDAIGTLDAYSFVSKRADQSLDIHRLVQLAMRNWLRLQKQWDIWMNEALARLVEVIPYGDYDKREVWTAFLPHAVHVVDLVEYQEAETEGRMLLLDRIGRCENTLGRYQAAELAHRKLLKERKSVLGKKHPETLISMNEEVRGKKHPSTLTSMNNLAQALSDQGKYEEAETMHRETLALKEEVLGKKHPSTLASMSNLAQALSKQGKYEEAETMHREELALSEEVLGKKHPETLRSVHNLAGLLAQCGQHEEALTLYHRACAGYQERLGPDHPRTRVCQKYYSLLHNYVDRDHYPAVTTS
jgi:tetratricopeptide (TPR) repeat protein